MPRTVKTTHGQGHSTLTGGKESWGDRNSGNQGQFCRLCNAWRGDLGLEPTPELYLDHMMLVMAEVWRVLRDDGVCMVNIADSYAGSPSGNPTYKNWKTGGMKDASKNYTTTPKQYQHIKPKSLCLIPQKFAIRCQEAGWIMRNEIIWAKAVSFDELYSGSTMPESVGDRCTRAHEQVWFMTKSGKYYWDERACKEIQVKYEMQRRRREHKQGLATKHKIASNGKTGQSPQGKHGVIRSAKRRGELAEDGLRNLRDVWYINPEPTPEAHFAAWASELVHRMIKMASRPGDVVLDPFCGTAKTMVEAEKLNRIGIGLDLSWPYLADIAKPRQEMPLQKEMF